MYGFCFSLYYRQAPRKHPQAARRHRNQVQIEARMSQIAVIGAGAWGTGLSIVLGRKGAHRVRLWAHEPDVFEGIARERVNQKFLPGHRIPDSVTPTNTLAEALDGAEILVSVMPSPHCRGIFEQMRPHLRQETIVVSATKGLEES